MHVGEDAPLQAAHGIRAPARGTTNSTCLLCTSLRHAWGVRCAALAAAARGREWYGAARRELLGLCDARCWDCAIGRCHASGDGI